MENEDESAWVKDYADFMKVGDFENALIIKEQYFPKAFFKYRELNDKTLTCLENDWLWMSKVDVLNDTFEGSLLLDHNEILRGMFTDPNHSQRIFLTGFSAEELKEIKLSLDPFDTYKKICAKRGLNLNMTSEEFLLKTTSAWEKDMKIMNDTIRICSFSTTNESLLMWSHYSQQYQGICVEYDLSNAGIVRTFTQPVYYSKQRISVKSFEEMNSYFHVVASISKSDDWKYEKEWRLTFFTESQIKGRNNQLSLPTPSAIYIGPRFHLNNEKDKQRLTAIALSKKIPIYQMANHPSEYKIIMTK